MNPIGFSTGALALGDFRRALGYLIGKPFTVVELSALRVGELPDLLQALPSLNLDQFDYIAIHAPGSFSSSEETHIVRLLADTPANWKIVLHPDTIHDHEGWAWFEDRLALENMDRRKPDGRSADEMSKWFSKLPQAKFCLDLAHAQQWDTTLTEAYLLLKQFQNRLCQIHISQLDSESHHHPLSEGSIRAFSELAWLVPEDVPIIIESRVSCSEMESEAANVRRIPFSVSAEANQLTPA